MPLSEEGDRCGIIRKVRDRIRRLGELDRGGQGGRKIAEEVKRAKWERVAYSTLCNS